MSPTGCKPPPGIKFGFGGPGKTRPRRKPRSKPGGRVLDVIARAKVENTRSLEHVPVIVGVVGLVGLGEALGKCEDYDDNAED